MQNRFRDWGDVRVFLAVMREGSTLAASRHLGINQTTVSRRIDVLEHTLGLTLFERTTRGAEPTEHATALLPFADSLEQAALAFEAAAETRRNSASEPIRITAFENEAFGDIGAVVAEFVDENPGVSFEFVFSERSLDLMKGEADVALGAGQYPVQLGAPSRRRWLLRTEQCWVACWGHGSEDGHDGFPCRR